MSMKLLFFPLSLFVVTACTSSGDTKCAGDTSDPAECDDSDSSDSDDTGDEDDVSDDMVTPREGKWDTSAQGWVDDVCGAANTIVVHATAIMLRNVTSDDFAAEFFVDGDSGGTANCDRTDSTHFGCVGDDQTFSPMAGATLTFSSTGVMDFSTTESGAGSADFEISCEGPSCADIEDYEGFTFPCTVTQTFDMNWVGGAD